MNARTVEQVKLLVKLGACSLDGKPAIIDWNRKVPAVVTVGGQNQAVFNPSVITNVVIKQGGRFQTREPRRFACV